MSVPLRIATRNSSLARAQSQMVGNEIARTTGLTFVLVPIVTSGDRDTEARLEEAGGVGFFTTEVEDAVRSGQADIAVHSLKDLPIRADSGVWYAFPRRVDPRDVVVPAAGKVFDSLESIPAGAVLATSSPRRVALFAEARPDLTVRGIRGNIDTRLHKIDDGLADAVILARAGCIRLGIDRPALFLDPIRFPPAAGQGVLAVQTFRQDVAETIRNLDDPETRLAAMAERRILAALGGGCQNAVGAYVRRTDTNRWRVDAAGKRGDRMARFAAESASLDELTAEATAALSGPQASVL